MLTHGRKMKLAVKDTVFRDLFSQKKYLLQMYQALHPDDTTITADDLDIVTLKSILMNGIYNDLGFMVRGSQLMVLVEAQSTWSPNIVIRSLMYLMETYQDYFRENKIKLYGSHKVDMPKPELYVIYTGDKGSHPDVLSLKDEFFSDTDCCIDVKVKTIYHTPKVLDEDPMDFIVLSKNDEEQTIKVRVYSTTPREINIHKNSLWGKVLVKKRLF